MAENRNVDELIYEACRQQKESLLALGPDFQKIETEALAKFKHRKKARMRKIWVQAVAAVASAFIIVNGAVILSAVPGVRAYGETVRKYIFNFANNVPAAYDDKLVLQTTEALKDAQAKVPFQIPFPHWIPEGYEVIDASANPESDGMYYVKIEYNQPNADKDQKIIISVTNSMNFANTKPSLGERPVDKKEIAGYDVYIKVKGDNPKETLYCMFYDKDLSVSVSGPIDIKVLRQILVSFQP